MAGKKTRKDKEKEYKNQVRSGGMMKGEGRAFSLRGIFRFLVIFIIGGCNWKLKCMNELKTALIF